MITYKQIFNKTVYSILRQQSIESRNEYLGTLTVGEASLESLKILNYLMEIERPYIKQLENLAVQIIKELYPIIDLCNIKIDAQIVDMCDFNMNQKASQQIENISQHPDYETIVKRRIINGITHGSAIRGSKCFILNAKELNEFDERLFLNYLDLINLSYSIYDDDEGIKMMLILFQSNNGILGGEAKVEITDTMTIRAKALTFPILLQEIVKGLYEIISLHGFSVDKIKNQKIVDMVDSVPNEPEDIRYGKFIYDAINELYVRYDSNNPLLRELFFVELYKLDDDAFYWFIHNAITKTLTTEQTSWINNTFKRLS